MLENKNELYFPNIDKIDEILNSAIYWLQIDYHDATRHEIEGYLHSEDFESLKQ